MNFLSNINKINNQKIKTYFIDIDTKVEVTKHKINIVLSPSLYWIKKVKLPVKKNKDVIPLLKTLFEDSLEKGDYQYNSYKISDNEYIIIAYDSNKILDVLKNNGINQNKIKNIYLSQNEFILKEIAIKINNTFLIKKDDVIIKLPKSLIKEYSEYTQIELNKIKLSKRKIFLFKTDLKIFNNYYLLSIMFFLIIILLTNIFIINLRMSNVENEMENVFENNHLKSTMFENKSILEKKEKHEITQLKLRNIFLSLSKLNLDSNISINSINIERNYMIIKMVNKNSINDNIFLKKIKKIDNKFKIYKNELTLKIKI